MAGCLPDDSKNKTKQNGTKQNKTAWSALGGPAWVGHANEALIAPITGLLVWKLSPPAGGRIVGVICSSPRLALPGVSFAGFSGGLARL